MDSSSKWYCQAMIPGSKDFLLQSLIFSPIAEERGRLFGVSLRGVVFEIDLKTQQIKNSRDSFGGAVWCIAASYKSSLLAVGCEDGSVRLFSYEGNSLEYTKTLPTSGPRITCCAFHPTSNRLFAGCSDGTIRCIDTETGRVLFRMTGDKIKGAAPTVFWCMKVLHDSTLVTGDSLGQVQLWDGTVGVWMQSYRQHAGDILALATSPDEHNIFASGVDGKVICIQKLKNDSSEQEESDHSGATAPTSFSWVYSHSHRAHSHDVLSLAVQFIPHAHVQDKSSAVVRALQMEIAAITGTPVTAEKALGNWVLLSGGLDTKMCCYSVSQFVKTRPSWITAIPANTLISHSLSYRLVAMRFRQHIDLWNVGLQSQLDKHDNAHDNVLLVDESACQLKLRLELKTDEYLRCLAVSQHSQWVVCYSSSLGYRMWRLGNQAKDVAAEPSSSSSSSSASSKKKSRKNVTPAETPAATADATLPIKLERISLPPALQILHSQCQAATFNNRNDELAVFSSKSGCILLVSVVDADSNNTASSSSAADRARSKSETDDETDREDYANEGCSVRLRITSLIHHKSEVESAHHRYANEEALSYAVRKVVYDASDSYLAVCSCHREVYIYSMESRRLHWRLPQFPALVTDVAFTVINEVTCCVVLLANNTFHLFDVAEMAVHEWTVKNGDKFPKFIRQIAGPMCGVSAQGTQLFLYGQGFCVFVDLTEAIPAKPKVITQATTEMLQKSLLKKRKAEHWAKKNKRVVDQDGDDEDGEEAGKEVVEEVVPSNFVMFNIYRNLLHVGQLPNSKQLVVMENPWMQVVESLPEVAARKRYGT